MADIPLHDLHHIIATTELVRAARYSSACAVKNALSHEHDLWALGRVMPEHEDGVDRLRRACEGDGYRLSRHRESALT